MVCALSEKMAAVRKHLNVNLMDQPHTDIGRTEMQINANAGRQQKKRWKYEEERTRLNGSVLSFDCWLVLRGDESELIMGI